MTNLFRRLSLILLLCLLFVGAAEHLFLSTSNTSHIAQEANCPLHSGMAQPEKIQPFTLKPSASVVEIEDVTQAFHLRVKISRPPTI